MHVIISNGNENWKAKTNYSKIKAATKKIMFICKLNYNKYAQVKIIGKKGKYS